MPGVHQLVALLSVLTLAVSLSGNAAAGPWPNLLDNNTGGSYSVAVSAVAHLLAPFACPPITCKVQAGGRVVANPKIVNLFWDDNWDAHNPGSLTKAQTNATVQLLTSSEYLDGANQYGVHRGNFVGASRVLDALPDDAADGAQRERRLAHEPGDDEPELIARVGDVRDPGLHRHRRAAAGQQHDLLGVPA